MHRLTILLLLVGTASCLERKHKDAPHADPAKERAERAARAAAEDERRAAVTAALATPPRESDAACPADVRVPQLPPLGDMQLAWSGDLAGRPGDQTRGYILAYLRMIGSEVEVMSPAGSGAPLDERSGFDDGARVTLVIDRWTDPVVPEAREGSFVVGHVVGRVLVWDPKTKAFVCGAEVDAQNGNVTLVDSEADIVGDRPGVQEDALSKVRIDLVNEALRAGLAHLRALATHA